MSDEQTPTPTATSDDAEVTPLVVEIDDEHRTQVAILRMVERRRREIKEELKDLAEKEENAIGVIQEAIGDAEEAKFKGKPAFTWPVTVQRRLNQKRLAATVGPEIFETLKDEIRFRTFKVLLPEDVGE